MFFSCPVARRNEILKSEPNEQYQKKIKDKAIANRITHSYYLFFGREMDDQGDLKRCGWRWSCPIQQNFVFGKMETFSYLTFIVDFRANAAKGFSMSNPGAIFDAMKNGINYIADALEAYLINDINGVWSDRADIFLKMIAGSKIDEKTVDYLIDKIEDFAEKYLLIRAYDDEDIDMYEASAHLRGASKEITEIFIHTLKNPGNRVQATLDPNPFPRGDPYRKYRIGRRALELKDKIQEWLKN